MEQCELAINERGEPFDVPPPVTAWRVYRVRDDGGRGRPKTVWIKGKALVVPRNASHADLLAAAGPGTYRLEAVDEHLHAVPGVDQGCTGPLRHDEEMPGDDDDWDPEMTGNAGPALRPGTMQEVLLCKLVSANTRLTEKAIGQLSPVIGQLGTVMSGVAELLTAAHNAGITHRLAQVAAPTALPIQAPITEPVDEAPESPFGMSQIVQMIIKEAIEKAVPLLFEKLAGGGLGIPLEAMFDWRKAAKPAEAPSAPPSSAPSWPVPPSPSAPSWSAPPSPSAPSWSAPPSPTAPSESPSWPAPSPITPSVPPPPAPASAGAPPTRPIPIGAAPAMRPSTTTPTPQLQEDAATLLNARMLQVWQGLAPPERARAAQLVARLTPDERAAWLAELAQLTLPEALARARAVLHGSSSTAPPSPGTPPTSTVPDDPPS